MAPDPERILRELDSAAEAYDFPMLDNQNFELADVRLSGYASVEGWCLLIEVLAFQSSIPAVHGISDLGCAFGSCIVQDRVNGMLNVLYPVDDGPNQPLFTGSFLFVNPETERVRIRGKTVPVSVDLDTYRAEGIPVDLAPEVTGHDFLRWLAPRYRDLLFATEEELYSRVTVRLPLILRLDEWHHPDLARGEKPSQTECFQQIAEVLAYADPSRYRPTEPPNTHWSNWLNK